jgi:hypothetical protein
VPELTIAQELIPVKCQKSLYLISCFKQLIASSGLIPVARLSTTPTCLLRSPHNCASYEYISYELSNTSTMKDVNFTG